MFFHFCGLISVKVVLTLSLQIYFFTKLLRFSCKSCVKNIWDSLLFWTGFHIVLLPTPKKLDVTAQSVRTCNDTIILDISFEWTSFALKFTSDCKFAINYSCCIHASPLHQYLLNKSVLESFGHIPWSWNTIITWLYQLLFLAIKTKCPDS